MTTHDELLDAAGFQDEEAALRVVERCLEEQRELSAELLYDLARAQLDPPGFERRALRLRADWFRKRGERVPKMPKPARTLE